MDCSIIIVNFNTRALLLDCINSILLKTLGVHYEIIVVDNGSIDGSQQEVRSLFPQVLLIESPQNLGFGKANNLGAGIAKGRYFFFLNSDTVLLNNAIKLFLEYFEENSDQNLGCIGCNLLDANLNINGNGGKFPQIQFYLKNRFSALKAKLNRSAALDVFAKDIDYVLGADMFMPGQIFNMVGGFDERYFMYFEESDLQLRIFELGYKMKIIDGPQIIHLEGKSTHHSIRKILMVQESAYKYYHKNRPSWEYHLLRTIGLIESLSLLIKPSYSFKDFITCLKFNLNNQVK